MLGKLKPQRKLLAAAAQLGADVVDQMGFYGQLSRARHKIFRDEDFAELYCPDNGRPSVPPSVLATARLLQVFEGISDREVVNRTRFDLRWKVALELDTFSIDPAFARSTYQVFRLRLTVHEKEGLLFEKSVKAAREAGLLPPQVRAAVDSTPVRGRGAVKDTFNLLSDAIVAVVRTVARKTGKKVGEVAASAGVERHLEEPSIKGSELVDWEDEESVSTFLGGLVDDCERTLAVAEAASCATEESAVLRKIVEQDVEPGDEQEGPKIRQGVAKDRTVSVADPDMRHGRKSSGKIYNGHKAHIAVDVDSGVITAVEVTSPSEADGSRVGSLIQQTAETTGSEVTEALGDAAYSSREAIRQATEANVTLVSKMPAPKAGQYGPGDFEVSEDRQTARCPAGHESARHSSGRKGGNEYIVHYWPEEQCGPCPLKEACTKAKRRTLSVHLDFHDRRAREQYARSAEGREHCRERTVVEHAIGRLKNLGAGTARYFGQRKTGAQWLWTAAVANLCLILGQEAVVGV